MTPAQSENDAHVEIESDDASDAQESSSSCLDDESSDEGNTKKKKTFSTKQISPCFSPSSFMRILHETFTQHAK